MRITYLLFLTAAIAGAQITGIPGPTGGGGGGTPGGGSGDIQINNGGTFAAAAGQEIYLKIFPHFHYVVEGNKFASINDAVVQCDTDIGASNYGTCDISDPYMGGGTEIMNVLPWNATSANKHTIRLHLGNGFLKLCDSATVPGTDGKVCTAPFSLATGAQGLIEGIGGTLSIHNTNTQVIGGALETGVPVMVLGYCATSGCTTTGLATADAFGSRIENLTVDGACNTGSYGIMNTSAQERADLWNVHIRNFDTVGLWESGIRGGTNALVGQMDIIPGTCLKASTIPMLIANVPNPRPFQGATINGLNGYTVTTTAATFTAGTGVISGLSGVDTTKIGPSLGPNSTTTYVYISNAGTGWNATLPVTASTSTSITVTPLSTAGDLAGITGATIALVPTYGLVTCSGTTACGHYGDSGGVAGGMSAQYDGYHFQHFGIAMETDASSALGVVYKGPSGSSDVNTLVNFENSATLRAGMVEDAISGGSANLIVDNSANPVRTIVGTAMNLYATGASATQSEWVNQFGTDLSVQALSLRVTAGSSGATLGHIVQKTADNPTTYQNASSTTPQVKGIALQTAASAAVFQMVVSGYTNCVVEGTVTAGHYWTYGATNKDRCLDTGSAAFSTISNSVRIGGVFQASGTDGQSVQVSVIENASGGLVDTVALAAALPLTQGGTGQTQPNNNIFMGNANTGSHCTTAGCQFNTYIGPNAGWFDTTGNGSSTGVGYAAMKLYGQGSTGNGGGSVCIGAACATSITSSPEFTLVGSGAMQNTTNGPNYMSGLGYQVLFYLTSGFSDTVMGHHAMLQATTANQATGMGQASLYSNMTGANNTAYGWESDGYTPLYTWTSALTTGTSNLGIGLYNYKIAYVLAGAATQLDADATGNQITTDSGHREVTLSSIPAYTGPIACSDTWVYRTKVGDTINKAFYKVGALGNCAGGSFVDTIADASVGAVNTDPSNMIILGAAGVYGGTAYKSSQFVVASDAAPITETWLGRGVWSATPDANVLVSATGGSGTNVAGSNLALSGGPGTGSAASGAVVFDAAAAGSTGSKWNAVAEVGRFNSTGLVLPSGAALTNTGRATGCATWSGAQLVSTGVACGAGGGGAAWDGITDPSANEALNMAAHTSTWTWNATTGSTVNLFNLTDTTNNTGTGFLLNVNLASGSAAKPFQAAVNGNGVSVSNAGLLAKVGTGGISATHLNGTALSGLATGLLKNTTGTGAPTIAVSGTDYLGTTSGSALQKADGSGGLTAASAGTDYVIPTGQSYRSLDSAAATPTTTGGCANGTSTPTTDVVSCNTETIVYSYSLPGGTLGSGSNQVCTEWFGDYFNNSGSNDSVIIKYKYGTTTEIASPNNAITAAVTRRAMSGRFCISPTAGLATTQAALGEMYIGNTSTTGGTMNAPNSTYQGANMAPTTINSANANNIAITATLGTNAATIEFRIFYARTYLKQN